MRELNLSRSSDPNQIWNAQREFQMVGGDGGMVAKDKDKGRGPVYVRVRQVYCESKTIIVFYTEVGVGWSL